MIDETARIHPSAKLADSVSVGPWSVIGADVEIDADTVVDSHVVIAGPTKIGKRNHIYPFASVGEDPQDKKFHGEKTWLILGDDNVVREFCTLNRGTENGGSHTRIGDRNLFMAYVHVAHDCIVGNDTIFANNAGLAGHVTVEDYVIFGAFSAVHQFCRIGAHAFIAGGGTRVIKDVLPYILIGEDEKSHGINSEGLKRRGFSAETIMALKRAYKIIFRQGLTTAEALPKLAEMVIDHSAVQAYIDGLKQSERGIVR